MVGIFKAVLQQGNVRIDTLQDTKLNGGIHTLYIASYKVWVMEVDSGHRGMVTIICK